ncbi:hypothetical protein Goshw_020954 [Gossypium schwendimanii]|uniref:Pesticidal crystal cry1Ag n=1 Tax=Gossypium schwendimanii TaxID=34291 RepID=A0A7J9LH43_GOSSC|nr:hypothetical protein [Gossypium schwendimanii]
MAGITARISWSHRNLTYGYQEFKFPDQPDSSSSDIEFGFLEDGDDGFFFGSCNGSADEVRGNEMADLGFGNDDGDDDDDDDEGKEKDGIGVENAGDYWESQHQLLEGTLRRTSSLESRIRNAAKEALNDVRRLGIVCGCGKSMTESCRVCVMREVCCRLQKAGFNTAVCRSKWRSSANIPSGEHTFLDVIEESRKGEVRVIVELNLRAEFEIARASDDYNRLVQRLPQIYVGKVERLNNVIKILCLAAKKCMKEKKMHMGPWRKHSYMQAKWLRFCERNTSTETPPAPVGCSVRSSKPRASLLTVDLLGTTLSNVRCAAV